MRVLFAALAAHGHVHPSIPLAIAARQAGHEVLFAAGTRFLPVLRSAGLDAAPAGMELPDALDVVLSRDGTSLGRDQVLGRMIGEVLPHRWATDLAPLVASFRPDLIVRDAGTLGAGLAGRVAGIPVLCHGFGRVSADPIGEAMVAAFTA